MKNSLLAVILVIAGTQQAAFALSNDVQTSTSSPTIEVINDVAGQPNFIRKLRKEDVAGRPNFIKHLRNS